MLHIASTFLNKLLAYTYFSHTQQNAIEYLFNYFVDAFLPNKV